MMLFDAFKGMIEVRKIKKGKKGKLSISQITILITNMADAKKNLSEEEYNKVYGLFWELIKCNTKYEMDQNKYCEMAKDIIERFNKIAPYQKYSGGNELEFSFLVDDISQDDQWNVKNDKLSDSDKMYIDYIVANAKGLVDEYAAKEYLKVLHGYLDYGKSCALDNFKFVANKIVYSYTGKDDIILFASLSLSFLIGALKANNIIDLDEMNTLNNKYSDRILELYRLSHLDNMYDNFDELTDEDMVYCNNIVKKSNGCLNEYDVKDFINFFKVYGGYDKETILDNFKSMSNTIIYRVKKMAVI